MSFSQLPEKESWNGLPTVIKIKADVKSRERNGTDNRIINATQTNYTWSGLKLNAEYQIQLKFCTNGGDGPSTTPLVLDPRTKKLGMVKSRF